MDEWIEDRWTELMRAGRFDEAWRLSDRVCAARRVEIECCRPRHFQIIWNGSSFDGRRVLVRCYHGLGDTIQFSRYLPMVHRTSADLTVWAQPALLSLLQTSFSDIRFIPLHDRAPDVEYDVDVEIMELAHAFRTSLTTIPADVPYLRVSVQQKDCPRPRLGFTWRAGDWDEQRSVPFHLVKRLCSGLDADVIPLQQSLTEEESVYFAGRTLLTTVDSLANQIADCDLVISVDTMSAHLAGALNVSTWTLLKHDADWRWMSDRSDSPWYPSMYLYRQPSHGAWRPVFEQLGRDLADFRFQWNSSSRNTAIA